MSLFHLMQNGINGAGADLISVVAQFLDEPQSIDGLFSRVVKDMNPYKAEKEISYHIYQTPIS